MPNIQWAGRQARINIPQEKLERLGLLQRLEDGETIAMDVNVERDSHGNERLVYEEMD